MTTTRRRASMWVAYADCFGCMRELSFEADSEEHAKRLIDSDMFKGATEEHRRACGPLVIGVMDVVSDQTRKTLWKL